MRLLSTLITALLLVVLSACSSGDDSRDDSAPSEEPTSSATPAKPAPKPQVGSCHAMTYEQSLNPTDESKKVGCKKKHTSQTFHVDSLATVLDGHLVSIDSDHAQQQIAAECPKQFARFVGGTEEDRRLSMLSVAWFSPTIEQSDAGQDWYRCDVTMVESSEKLGALSGELEGALGSQDGRDRFGMCSTGEPGTKQFNRVVCSQQHSWRAVSTVDVEPAKGDAYPGVQAAKDAAGAQCEDAARSQADDPLSVTWGYEWPTKQQWRAGRHYGFCWTTTG